MPETHPYENLGPEWSLENSFRVDVDTDIRLGNRNELRSLFFVITTSDGIPAIDVAKANPLKALEAFPATLKAGERIWLGAQARGSASILEG